MAYMAMAYIVMAYIVMANGRGFWHASYEAYCGSAPHAGYGIVARWGRDKPHGLFSMTSNIDGHWLLRTSLRLYIGIADSMSGATVQTCGTHNGRLGESFSTVP